MLRAGRVDNNCKCALEEVFGSHVAEAYYSIAIDMQCTCGNAHVTSRFDDIATQPSLPGRDMLICIVPRHSNCRLEARWDAPFF